MRCEVITSITSKTFVARAKTDIPCDDYKISYFIDFPYKKGRFHFQCNLEHCRYNFKVSTLKKINETFSRKESKTSNRMIHYLLTKTS